MPTSSSNRTAPRRFRARRHVAGATLLWLGLGCALVLSGYAHARKPKISEFAPTMPASATPVAASASPSGAIIAIGSYAPLTSGARASQVGDIVTIVLVERTSATKSSTSATNRTGNVGLTPPTTGPLALFNPTDINMGGTGTFNGKGEAAQSNALTGEVSVTVVAVYPNGTMLIRGEKQLTLNRGDEHLQISGLIRSADIGTDNRVASTRVADARIRYIGKGEIAGASKQGWLQRFFSKVSPF